MALSGIQIYKLLPGGERPPNPKANCKECGFPTCLAFAMKLAAKQAELALCPYVSEESQTQLSAASAPPIRLVALGSNGHTIQAGQETVMFRHEKTFFNRPGLFLRVNAATPAKDVTPKVKNADDYSVNYVGMDLTLDGFAIDGSQASADQFSSAVEAVVSLTEKPLILASEKADVISAGLKAAGESKALVYGANSENWEAFADVANEFKVPVAISGADFEELADLTQKFKNKGVKDLVIDPQPNGLYDALSKFTQLRRLALKKNFRPLGYPVIAFPGDWSDDVEIGAMQSIAKYAGID